MSKLEKIDPRLYPRYLIGSTIVAAYEYFGPGDNESLALVVRLAGSESSRVIRISPICCEDFGAHEVEEIDVGELSPEDREVLKSVGLVLE